MNRHLPALRRARKQAHALLRQKPNVVGTGLGYKLVDGRQTRQPSVLVFVAEKGPIAELSEIDAVPAKIQVGGYLATTDVISFHRPHRQVTGPPWSSCDDGDHQGTVTAFLRNAGQGMALTCAHCCVGADSDLSEASTMSLWDGAASAYQPVGNTTLLCADTGGNGLPGDFGFSDWAIFGLESSSLGAAVLTAPSLRTGPARVGSRLHATAAGDRRLVGGVTALEAEVYGWRADVLQGPTVDGDSGLLWHDGEGRGVAMHAAGNSEFCSA